MILSSFNCQAFTTICQLLIRLDTVTAGEDPQITRELKKGQARKISFPLLVPDILWGEASMCRRSGSWPPCLVLKSRRPQEFQQAALRELLVNKHIPPTILGSSSC